MPHSSVSSTVKLCRALRFSLTSRSLGSSVVAFLGRFGHVGNVSGTLRVRRRNGAVPACLIRNMNDSDYSIVPAWGLANRCPRWLKRNVPKGNADHFTARLLDELRLETVCEHARCPNRMECYAQKTATFLILGDVCTRACRFCGVAKGRPVPPGPDKPPTGEHSPLTPRHSPLTPRHSPLTPHPSPLLPPDPDEPRRVAEAARPAGAAARGGHLRHPRRPARRRRRTLRPHDRGDPPGNDGDGRGAALRLRRQRGGPGSAHRRRPRGLQSQHGDGAAAVSAPSAARGPTTAGRWPCSAASPHGSRPSASRPA